MKTQENGCTEMMTQKAREHMNEPLVPMVMGVRVTVIETYMTVQCNDHDTKSEGKYKQKKGP